MDEDDRTLLAAVRDGSERAFNVLIDRHQQGVRAFLRNLVGDSSDADDIAQDTFLAVWTQARSYRGQASVRSWLFAIAWRQAKDSQRSWFRRRRRETAYHEMAAPDAERPARPDERIALMQALGSLPLDQRGAVALCLGCGLTHGEAAEALGLPLGTVKSHVARGRARLLALLGEDE